MTFLAPFALFGMLLLALPIVVHLFKPRKMRQMPFSSLRWLKETHQRMSRRVQWHQWPLFLLRAGCLFLLVAALAKPLLGTWGEALPVDRFIIIDNSRSMGMRLPEDSSPLRRATELAGRYALTARSGDRTAVIIAGSPPRLLLAPNADPSTAVAEIEAIKPSQADTNLTSTLPLIRSLLSGHGERDAELVFLTDNLQNRWKQKDVTAFLRELPNPVRVRVIETGARFAQNAWIANARLLQFGADEDRWLRVEVGCVGDAQPARSVRLVGITGIQHDEQRLTLKPGMLARVDFRIPASLKLQGQVAELRLEPADALPSDDVFFLNLDNAGSLRVLLVEPELPGSDGRRVGLFLETAMKVLTASKNQALDVATRTSATVTAGDLQKADVILLAGVPELSDAALDGLQARVRAGAGLALFLGPRLDTRFYNQKLYRPHQPGEGLLPLPLKLEGQAFAVEGKPGALTNVSWTHPLLGSLRDPVLSDFPQARFRRYGNLVGVLANSDTVLARFDDETPAIVERPLGAGRVLLFNTSANDEWSDLPRLKSFLPLVDRMLTHLSAGGGKRSFMVGDSVTLPLAEHDAKSEVTVVSPSGVKLSPRLLVQRGPTLLHLDAVAEAGVYRIEGVGKKGFVFTVNAARTDSPLSPMDRSTLEAWWSPAPVDITSAETARERIEPSSGGWPIWPTLIVLAGLLLIAETIYVHRLCPRADPKAAAGIVARRGVIEPVGGKA
jgi:Aerotolerance regulator N-terminal/von Willebrand factor type A domain